MLSNLIVLCYIVGIILLPINQKRHFAIAFATIVQLLKTFIILLLDAIALFWV